MSSAGRNAMIGRYTFKFLRMLFLATLSKRIRAIAIDPYHELPYIVADSLMDDLRDKVRIPFRWIGFLGMLIWLALFIPYINDQLPMLHAHYHSGEYDIMQSLEFSLPKPVFAIILVIFVCLIVVTPIIFLTMFVLSFFRFTEYYDRADPFMTLVAFRFIRKKHINEALKKYYVLERDENKYPLIP